MLFLAKQHQMPIKLHLGCGNVSIPNYMNVDVRNTDAADLKQDIQTLLSFEAGTVDLIYASHVLEHFGRRKYKQALSRWFELLRSGATLRIAVPDMEAVMKYYLETKNLEAVRGFLWGGQTYPENTHYCGWDFDKMKGDLQNIGFTNVRRYDWRLTEHAHLDDYSQSYLPHMDKENGTLMSLNVEATKP